MEDKKLKRKEDQEILCNLNHPPSRTFSRHYADPSRVNKIDIYVKFTMSV